MLKKLMAMLVITLLMLSTVASADQDEDGGICRQWGVNFWGMSYHIDKDIKFNSTNWGTGISCYKRPEWKWLGKSEDNRVFIQTDAMLNSYKGLLVLESVGVEYKLMTISGSCKIFADVALTLAYYQNPIKENNEIKFGPVPGLVLGCGNIKSNVTFVPSVDKNHLAVVAMSFSVLF